MNMYYEERRLTDDAVGREEPHFIPPFFWGTIRGLSSIVVDQVCILDIFIKRRVQLGVCKESRKALGFCHDASNLWYKWCKSVGRYVFESLD